MGLGGEKTCGRCLGGHVPGWAAEHRLVATSEFGSARTQLRSDRLGDPLNRPEDSLGGRTEPLPKFEQAGGHAGDEPRVIGAQLGAAVLAESSLSFLGFGAPSTQPSLGLLIGGGAQTFIHRAPWMVLWPGAAITMLVLGVNLLSDALAEALRGPATAGLSSAT